MPVDYPLFVLPGIMGTRLYFTETEKEWDPDAPTEMLRYWYHLFPTDNRADLHFDRQPAVVQYDPDKDVLTPDQKARGWGGPVWKYYGKLLKALEADHPNAPVYAIGYDWRKRIKDIGTVVGGQIASTLTKLGKNDFGVVMHSMGGLVVRSAFVTYPDLKAKAKMAVFICPPTVGAPVMYRRLFTGATADLDGAGFEDLFFRNIIGNEPEYFSKNASVLPGALQLLPSGHYPRLGNAYWHNDLATLSQDQLYTTADSPPGVAQQNIGLPAFVITDLRTRAGEVNDFHKHLGPPAAALPASSFLIYGTQLKTDASVNRAGGRIHPDQQTAGDATVPAASATALGLPASQMYNITALEHGAACNDPQVISTVRKLLS